jgi:hypothetical protein
MLPKGGSIQEMRVMLDLVFLTVLVGFFGLCRAAVRLAEPG